MIIDTAKHMKEYQKGIVDCWTLVQDIHKDNGIILPDYIDVNSASKRNTFKEQMTDIVEYEELDHLERGALILFESNPWHCGIAIDDAKMIHRAEGINTRIERVDRYGKKVAGIYLVKRLNP